MTLSNNSKSDMEFLYLIRFISFFLTFCFDFQILHLHETHKKRRGKTECNKCLESSFLFLEYIN